LALISFAYVECNVRFAYVEWLKKQNLIKISQIRDALASQYMTAQIIKLAELCFAKAGVISLDVLSRSDITDVLTSLHAADTICLC